MLTCLTTVSSVVMSNLYSVFSSLIMELEELGYLPMPKGLVIEEKITRGAFCTIHRGTLYGKPVAVKKSHKIMSDAASEKPKFMIDMKRRFIQARNLLCSDHPGVVNIFGAYYDKQTGETMLVTELMKKNLRKFLAEVKGHLRVAEQCTMCRDIASALVYLHQQDPPIVYCDLTSETILISFDGQAKLRACGEAQQTSSAEYYGPYGGGASVYLPPEALRDVVHYGRKIDIFSLGVVMNEIATQHPPSVGFMNIGIVEEIKRRQSDLSKIPEDHPLKPIILQCLQDNPVDRPNSASVLEEIKKTCPVSQRKYHLTHLLIQILSMYIRLPILVHPILHLPPTEEWIEAYQEALEKQGSVSVGVTRCLFIGPPAVGKSSLKHLLVRNKSKVVKTSTPVMEAPDVVRVTSEQYAIEEGSSNWEIVEGETMTQSVKWSTLNRHFRFSQSVKKESKTKDNRSGIVPVGDTTSIPGVPKLDPIGSLNSGHVDGQDDISTSTPQLPLSQLDRALDTIQKESSVRKGWNLNNASFIHLLDSGGQPCFLNTLPLVLAVPCTYALVFNASQDLDQPLPVSYRPDKDTEEILSSTQTGRDLMQRLMSSFHTMGVKHLKEMSHFQEHGAQSPKPRIFLVGTFKDVLQQEDSLPDRCKEISDVILTTSHLPAFRRVVKDPSGRPFYLVNNNLTTDPDTSSEEFQYISHLRSSLSSSDTALKMEVPLMWYLLQQVTHRSGQRLIRYTELKEFATKHQLVISEKQFSSFVKLFHLLGFFVYFDFEDDPRILP